MRAKEATVLTDPCDKSTGYALGRPTADLVTVSMDTPGHNWVAGVAGEPRVIDGPGEFEIAHVSVVGVTTRAAGDNAAPGRNVAYVIDLEDLRICHLGGLDHVPSSDQIEEIGGVDIIMVPVGGGDALGATVAAEVVSLIEPKIVIPMYYKTDLEKAPIDPIDRFLKEMGAKTGESHAKLAVTRSSLPEETQVLVVDYKR